MKRRKSLRLKNKISSRVRANRRIELMKDHNRKQEREVFIEKVE